MVGDKSWLVGQYLKPLARPGWEVVWSGWGWEGVDKITARIVTAQKSHIPVFVDPSEFANWEKNDMDIILRKFKTTKYIYHTYKIEPL